MYGQEENTNEDNWYNKILGILKPETAEASEMPAKAIRATPAPQQPATQTPGFNINDQRVQQGAADLFANMGKKPGMFSPALQQAAKPPQPKKSLATAADKLKQSKKNVAAPAPSTAAPAPAAQNRATTYPVPDPKFTGTSTSADTTMTKKEDPTQVLGTIGELGEAQKKLLTAKIPPYQEFLKDVEQKQKEKFGNTERAYQAYHADLDKSSRGQFWQDMIHALGQVVAGGTAYATEKPVMDYYKPVKVFDKKAVDADSKARMEMQTNLAKQRFDDAVQSLQARRDLTVEEKTMAYAVEVDKLKRVADVLKTTIPMEQKTEQDKQDIEAKPQPKASGGAKSPQFVEQKDPTYPNEAAKTNTEILTKMSPFINNPVTGNTPEEQARSYANPRSVRGAFPSLALEKLYMYAYDKSQDKNPASVVKIANSLLTNHLSQMPDASTRQAYDLAIERQALQQAGMPIFWKLPQVMMRTKDGTIEYNAADPLDRRNPHAYIHKVDAAKKQLQSQGKK